MEFFLVGSIHIWRQMFLGHFWPTHYGEDFTHGFGTQSYPKLQASLGIQPENTHRIQRQPQPIPVDFFA